MQKWFYSFALKWISNHVSLQVLSGLNLSWQIAGENLVQFKFDVHAIGHGNIGFCCKECITFQQQKSYVLTGLYKGSWIWNSIFRLFIELDVSAC